MLSLLSLLGGLVSVVLMWSHSHPHETWSLWTLTDLGAVGLMVAGLRLVNRRADEAPPAACMSAILAESTRMQ
jgi:hypothetical protein